MRKAISVAALTLALTCPVYAGDMQNGITGTPPNTKQEGTTASGLMPNVEPDSLTETMLSVLETVLSLL